MQSSGIVQQPDMRNLLKLPQDEMFQAFQRSGAVNAAPPLVRSTHLKNKNTGVVFPWNPLLAEQRDIMVNCDVHGNTDPVAWQDAVNPEPYTEEDRDRDYWAARESVVKQAMQLSGGYEQSLQASSIPQNNRIPGDVEPLDKYYERLAADVKKLQESLEF